MKIEKKPIDQLIPADYNPRKDLKPGNPEYNWLKQANNRLVGPFIYSYIH